MPAVVGEISCSKMNPLLVIIFAYKYKVITLSGRFTHRLWGGGEGVTHRLWGGGVAKPAVSRIEDQAAP